MRYRYDYEESSEIEDSLSPDPYIWEVETSESGESEEESEEYSPSREQEMIDSIYFNPEIPEGSPEIGQPTTPLLAKTIEDLVAREPGAQTVSTDSHVYDPVSSPTPKPRRVNPRKSPFNTYSDSEPESISECSKECDAPEDPETVGANPEDPTALSRTQRPEWYHPHTNMSNKYFETHGNWPRLLEDYKEWRKKTFSALAVAALQFFPTGDLDEHRDSIFFRAGDRKTFGIITLSMEKGMPGLEEAVEKDVKNRNTSPWPMRDWVIVGRAARDARGKRGLLQQEVEITAPGAFGMSSKELLQALDEYGKGGFITPASISPRTVTLPPFSAIDPLTVATFALPSGPLIPGPIPAAPAPPALPPASSVPNSSSAAGQTTTAAGPSSSAARVRYYPESLHPMEVFKQWRKVFSSSLVKNGGTVQAFSEIPLWAKKMQFLHGLPKEFEGATANIVRQHRRRLFREDPFDSRGNPAFGSSRAVTWRYLVKEMKREERRLREEKRLKGEKRKAIEQETRKAEEQLMQEAAQGKNQAGKGAQGFRETNAAKAVGPISKALPPPQEKVPSPPNEPNAPLRTPFYKFTSSRKPAYPTKDALPARSALKQPSPPTASGSAAAAANTTARLAKKSDKSKAKSAATENIKPATSSRPDPPPTSYSRPAPSQSGALVKKDSETGPAKSTGQNVLKTDPAREFDDKIKLDLPCTPVKKPKHVSQSTTPAQSSAPVKRESQPDLAKSTSQEPVKTIKQQVSDNKTKLDVPRTPENKPKPVSQSAAGPKNTVKTGPPEIPNNKPKPNLPRTPERQPKPVSQSAGVPRVTTSTLPSKTGYTIIKPEPLSVPLVRSVKPDIPIPSDKEALQPQAIVNPGSQPVTTLVPETPPRKTLIDPRRIDVDPDTLPDYCNTCRKTGHADRTRHCPHWNPFSGVTIGPYAGRAVIPGKTEVARLLKERNEVLEKEKHAAAKAERKKALAERKKREREERERLEQERLDEGRKENESMAADVSKALTMAPQATVQGVYQSTTPTVSPNAAPQVDSHAKKESVVRGDQPMPTTPPNAAAQVESKRAKKRKAKKENSSAALGSAVPASGAKDDTGDNHQRAEPEKTKNGLLVDLTQQPEPPALAGTKRKLEQVDEVADLDKAERKRRHKEKRRLKREAQREKKERAVDCPTGE
ncbi:hypothetical protein IWX49DRAFT_426200 [Phyllosticta citricarpa]